MFTRKKEMQDKIRLNEDAISFLDSKLSKHINKSFEMVECDVCGCLLDKRTAIKGKSTIGRDIFLNGMFLGTKEIIREHYFCKVHAPKGKK